MPLNLPLFSTSFSNFPTILVFSLPLGNSSTFFLSSKKVTNLTLQTIALLQSLLSSLRLWRPLSPHNCLPSLKQRTFFLTINMGFDKSKFRSTGDLLAYAVHAWSSAVESYHESRVISLDVSKAFDRVWYKGLLAKLPLFGLHYTIIKWISSLLSDRSIAIRVDVYLSKPHSINSGVPQGSVISPVLFILVINDLLSSTSYKIFSFSDDTYLSSSFSSNQQHLAYSNI